MAAALLLCAIIQKDHTCAVVCQDILETAGFAKVEYSIQIRKK